MEMDSPFKQAMFAIDSKALQRHLNHRLMAQLHTFEGPQPSLKKTFLKDPLPVAAWLGLRIVEATGISGSQASQPGQPKSFGSRSPSPEQAPQT